MVHEGLGEQRGVNPRLCPATDAVCNAYRHALFNGLSDAGHHTELGGCVTYRFLAHLFVQCVGRFSKKTSLDAQYSGTHLLYVEEILAYVLPGPRVRPRERRVSPLPYRAVRWERLTLHARTPRIWRLACPACTYMETIGTWKGRGGVIARVCLRSETFCNGCR